MRLEVISVVCGVGTEVDCDESDMEWDTDDGDGCCWSAAVTWMGSAFTGGVELVSGRVS